MLVDVGLVLLMIGPRMSEGHVISRLGIPLGGSSRPGEVLIDKPGGQIGLTSVQLQRGGAPRVRQLHERGISRSVWGQSAANSAVATWVV